MVLLAGLVFLASRALRTRAAEPNATLDEAQLKRQPFGGQPCLQ
jgi:hypothetical protein